MGVGRTKTILTTIQQVRDSQQSVREYFETHTLPFSRVQYYKYSKILRAQGEAGLRDQREDGNYRKITESIQEYMKIKIEEDPSISSRELQQGIVKKYRTKITKATVNYFRKSNGMKRVRPSGEAECRGQGSGGGEILTSLAFHSGILDMLTTTIVERIEEARTSTSFAGGTGTKEDHPRFRHKGRFTREYNQLKSVRESRFQSIEQKIPRKNYSSMDVLQRSQRTIARYNLALLCLP